MRKSLVRPPLVGVSMVLGFLTLAAVGTAMGAVASTTLVSVNSAEGQGNDSSEAAAISADGRYVAFASAADNLSANDNNYVPDIFVRDRVAGVTEVVSVASDGTPADNYSLNPDISADGHYVCFESSPGTSSRTTSSTASTSTSTIGRRGRRRWSQSHPASSRAGSSGRILRDIGRRPLRGVPVLR
jgi:hypothetical protein